MKTILEYIEDKKITEDGSSQYFYIHEMHKNGRIMFKRTNITQQEFENWQFPRDAAAFGGTTVEENAKLCKHYMDMRRNSFYGYNR